LSNIIPLCIKLVPRCAHSTILHEYRKSYTAFLLLRFTQFPYFLLFREIKNHNFWNLTGWSNTVFVFLICQSVLSYVLNVDWHCQTDLWSSNEIPVLAFILTSHWGVRSLATLNLTPSVYVSQNVRDWVLTSGTNSRSENGNFKPYAHCSD
jgi:hypothetical protein